MLTMGHQTLNQYLPPEVTHTHAHTHTHTHTQNDSVYLLPEAIILTKGFLPQTHTDRADWTGSMLWSNIKSHTHGETMLLQSEETADVKML